MFEFTDRIILCIKVLNDLNMREKIFIPENTDGKVKYFSNF